MTKPELHPGDLVIAPGWTSETGTGSGEREAANPHVMECNYRLGPIGAPGCICRVVNRALSSGERVRALEEALREAVTLLSGPLTVLHRVHTPSFWICTCEAEADSDYPTGKPCSCPRPEAKSGCVENCPACAATAARSAFVERVRRALSSAPPSPDSGERVRAPSPHSEAESGPQWMPGGAFCSCGEVEFLVPGTATVRTSTRGVALPTVHTPTECRSATWDEVSNLSAPVPAESATTAKCANRSGQGEEDGR